MVSETPTTAEQYRQLALTFRTPSPGSDPEARAAYARLFVVPGQALATPYESVHREGRLMGQTAARVAELYAEAGLQLPSHPSELPDHLSIELAFMAHLAGREGRDPAGAEAWRARQRSFLELHLAQWIPDLCLRILASNAHSYYHPAARLALQLIEHERARLAAKAGPRRQAEQEPLTDRALPASARPRKPDRICSSSDHRRIFHRAYPASAHRRSLDRASPSSAQRRFPNIALQATASVCTLCTLCADACRRGALRIRCTPSTISLVFEAAACNGCRACARLCPEAAIQLRSGPALPAPSAELPRVVLTAARAICPGCDQPHIAAPWLERLQARMEGQERIQSSLAYCPLCKVGGGARSPQPVTARQEVRGHD